MSLLSVAEQTQIRTDAAAAACDQSCQIQRASISYGAGGATVTWPLVATVNAGMGEPSAGGALGTQEYHLGDKAVWKVRFPVGTDVREQDRLVIAGRTLSVAKLLTPRSYAALVSVLVTE
jgi:hypothetical protein